MATVTLVSDAFNRADGALGAADSGQTWAYAGCVVGNTAVTTRRR